MEALDTFRAAPRTRSGSSEDQRGCSAQITGRGYQPGNQGLVRSPDGAGGLTKVTDGRPHNAGAALDLETRKQDLTGPENGD